MDQRGDVTDRRDDEAASGTSDSASPLPYRGLRVLDASQGFAGPHCAMLLAQHGAQVTKLEPPEGDWSRGIGRRYGDQSALALAGNRGKRSLAIDIKRPGAQDVVRRIADQCDVVIESFRPGVAQRLGLGYDALRATNPGLIYASVSGYGQDGPYAQRAGTDMVIQAFSGMMSVNRDIEGRPGRIGFLVVDTLTGLYAFQAVSSALYARLAGDGGRRLDISLMQSSAAFLGLKIIQAALEGEQPAALNAPAGVYRTRDGSITVTLSKEEHFSALCRAIGRPDLRADPRYASFETRAAHLGELVEAVGTELLRGDTADWLARIEAAGGLANPVNTLRQWLADPHVQATGAAPSVELPGVGSIAVPQIPGIEPPAPSDPRSHWPGIGTEGSAVLRDFGFADEEIERLRAASILIERAAEPST
jgi:crotonobetainyl-CoA:carnitine CoA-transferase CaiB-like acyl-CoA transferase